MKVNTSRYKLLIGKRPKGHALWFFRFALPLGEEDIQSWTGTYGQARDEAILYAKVAGAKSICLMH